MVFFRECCREDGGLQIVSLLRKVPAAYRMYLQPSYAILPWSQGKLSHSMSSYTVVACDHCVAYQSAPP